MAILTPVLSKQTLTAGTPVEVFFCPETRTHAILDITFFKDLVTEDSMLEIALSTKTNPALLNSVDYFIDDIELIGGVTSAELNKVIVGAGERLYIQVVSGPDVNIRVTGVEETNPSVLKAGRLGAIGAVEAGVVTVFNNNALGTSYASCSVTVYNASQADSAEVEAWITSDETPGTLDKVMRVQIPIEDTTIIENVMLAAGEKIVFSSSQPLTEYFVNGLVVKAM